MSLNSNKVHKDQQNIEHLSNVRQRITQSCALVKRSDPVFLIAVSKTFDASCIQDFYDLGLRDFGENYIQEWADKRQRLPEDIVWHIIGSIQSNKTKIVAEHAQWVHTIDRLKIAERLSSQRPENLPPLNVCIEVNISGSQQKHGVAVEEVLLLAQQIVTLPRLKLRGLMCIPSPEPNLAREQMQKMLYLFHSLQQQGLAIDVLSMGMSNDLEIAIACGATHVRVGSALFGYREKKQ